MAVAGRKPKQGGQTRHRVPPRHEWSEVENKPYEGRHPSLGRRYRGAWPPATKRWWEMVCHMPHCRLWSESDWQFALDTAEVHARFAEGTFGGTELRIREKLLGTTVNARRDLRIRYIEVGEVDGEVSDAARVVGLDDYR